MGFYGNITNTSKTTFSFDLVYSTRKDMDDQAQKDGVFLGRYVLIDYDEEPITGYFKQSTDPDHVSTETEVIGSIQNLAQGNNLATAITLRPGVLYKDLTPPALTTRFYKCIETLDEDQKIGKFLLNNSTQMTPYYSNFETDVNKYGRGYDSTVWVKRFEPQTSTYKYAMIAELNAVIPTLHMVVDKPNPIPTTPYFDRDTTNIDYYIHTQADFGNRVKALPLESHMVEGNMKSDEVITVKTATLGKDNNGYPVWVYGEKSEVPADIYYNKDGFDVNKHNFSNDKVIYKLMDDNGEQIEGKTVEVDYAQNQIGYDYGRSGKLYGADADLGVYKQGLPADDIYDWFIRLPGIGNSICKMWDKVYGYREEDNKRYLNDALTYEDKTNNLVSYDRNTMIGVMNTAQDLIGYHFISLDEYNPQEIITWPTDIEEMPQNFLITVNLKYDNEIDEQSAVYEVLKCIFYSTDENGNKKYYAYHYAPNYGEPVEPEFEDENKTAFKDNKIYYYKENDIYHIANPKTYKTTDANGNIILSTSEYYLATPEWKLESINTIADSSIQTLIAQIHTMLGTNIGEVRDMNSVQGAINTMKDIIANININLAPGRLLHTNNSGIIETVGNTYFPSATWDRDEVLDGNGDWVSRFATVKVLENFGNDNQKNPEVNIIVDGSEQNVATVIESDNDKSHTGTSLVNYKKHTTNNLTLGSRNKWIELYGNADKDSIEFKHSQSPIVSRLRAEQAEGSSYVDMFEGIDENENVILKDSTSFKNFSVNDKATEIKVEPTTDNLNYKNSDSDKNDNRLTIPYITVDNAGHVVELGTKNFNIPNTFKKIKTSTIDDGNESKSEDQSGMLVADSINDELELAPQNRWIDISIAEESNQEDKDKQDDKNLIDKITFGHRLINDLSKVNDKIEKDGVLVDRLNGERRSDVNKIPTVYRFGLPQDKSIADLDEDFGGYDKDKNKIVDPELIREKANTFNIPYIEIDKAGHVVAAETHTVKIPENFEKITLETAEISNESEINSNTGNFAPTTLQDNITFKTGNRWLNANISEKSITFGHELVELNDVVRIEKDESDKDINVYLNKAQNAEYDDSRRLSNPEIIPTVYRYGLPQDKNISMLDKDNGTEKANTFNVPYIEVDKAGHIVAAATHTVEIPDGYTTINVGDPISDELTTDELVGAKTMTANTLTDVLTIKPSNKWIRLKGENIKDTSTGTDTDTITIGHEIHTIATPSNTTDLDVINDKNIITQSIEYDDAGHIISKHTETWKLPYSLRNIDVTTAEALDKIENKSEVATIKATQISDTFKFSPANNWIRLQTNDHEILFGHLTQGTAGTYTGTNLKFTEFGGTVTIYGYTTDDAGHIIGNPTYDLTLPKGSYDETKSNNANVLTSLTFTGETGALYGYKTNIGELLLTGYTTKDITSDAIKAEDSLNQAIAKIEAQILKEQTDRIADVDVEEQARIAAIDAEAKARSDADTLLQQNINKENEERKTAISEETSARDKAIADAIQALWQDLNKNYNLVLIPPTIDSISKTVTNNNQAVQLVVNITKVEGDTYSYRWNTGETTDTITVTQNGDYNCVVTRNHNGWETSSEPMTITVSEITPTV